VFQPRVHSGTAQTVVAIGRQVGRFGLAQGASVAILGDVDVSRELSSMANPQDNQGGVAEDAPPLTSLGKPNNAQAQKAAKRRVTMKWSLWRMIVP
jgi:hypothetical protein